MKLLFTEIPFIFLSFIRLYMSKGVWGGGDLVTHCPWFLLGQCATRNLSWGTAHLDSITSEHITLDLNCLLRLFGCTSRLMQSNAPPTCPRVFLCGHVQEQIWFDQLVHSVWTWQKQDPLTASLLLSFDPCLAHIGACIAPRAAIWQEPSPGNEWEVVVWRWVVGQRG